MENLNLTQKSAYALRVSTDEHSSKISGYYKDSNMADIDAKGAGWYGSDGCVESATVYEDENGEIYQVKHLGKYKDVDREYREETMEKIRSKLTDAERKVLGI